MFFADGGISRAQNMFLIRYNTHVPAALQNKSFLLYEPASTNNVRVWHSLAMNEN